MKTIAVVAPSLLALLVTGCATNPASIRPVQADYQQFMIYDCASLTDKVVATDKELRRYVTSQGTARVADAITWPIPTSRIFGKNRRNVDTIGRLSGELEALREARTLQCEDAAV